MIQGLMDFFSSTIDNVGGLLAVIFIAVLFVKGSGGNKGSSNRKGKSNSTNIPTNNDPVE